MRNAHIKVLRSVALLSQKETSSKPLALILPVSIEDAENTKVSWGNVQWEGTDEQS